MLLLSLYLKRQAENNKVSKIKTIIIIKQVAIQNHHNESRGLSDSIGMPSAASPATAALHARRTKTNRHVQVDNQSYGDEDGMMSKQTDISIHLSFYRYICIKKQKQRCRRSGKRESERENEKALSSLQKKRDEARLRPQQEDSIHL